MMTHQAGVRTIAVGGRPEAGPMQASGGTRGALAYGADLLDEDFYYTNDQCFWPARPAYPLTIKESHPGDTRPG